MDDKKVGKSISQPGFMDVPNTLMNPFIFFLKFYLNRLSQRDRGFVLPLVIMMGLVLMVASLGIIASSHNSQKNTTAQKTSAEGLAIAETGITRILDLINQNKYIAQIPDCVGTRDSSGRCLDDGGTSPSYTPTNTNIKSWANITSTDAAVQEVAVCAESSPLNSPQQLLAEKIKAEAILVNAQTWKPLDSSNLDKGQYRLVSYDFDGSSTGTLTVEGRVNTDKLNSGAAKLTVSFPVIPNQVAPTVPGVWLTVGDTGDKNQIRGNVLLSDCDGNPSIMEIAQPSPPVNPPYSVVYTKQTMPSLPNVSCPSDTANSPSNPSNTAVPAWSFPASAATYTTPANKLNNSGDITLPRTETISGVTTIVDSPVDRELGNKTTVSVYEYFVNKLDRSGNNSITITPGKRVTLYLNGNIDGNNDIIHSCLNSGNPISGCTPADFQIFAYAQPVVSGGTTTRPKVCLNGNGKLEGFILAPEYTVGISGGAGGSGGVKGTIWAYDWSDSGGCGSNTQAIVVEQTAAWGDMYGLGLPQNQPPAIQNISSWQRKQR